MSSQDALVMSKLTKKISRDSSKGSKGTKEGSDKGVFEDVRNFFFLKKEDKVRFCLIWFGLV